MLFFIVKSYVFNIVSTSTKPALDVIMTHTPNCTKFSGNLSWTLSRLYIDILNFQIFSSIPWGDSQCIMTTTIGSCHAHYFAMMKKESFLLSDHSVKLMILSVNVMHLRLEISKSRLMASLRVHGWLQAEAHSFLRYIMSAMAFQMNTETRLTTKIHKILDTQCQIRTE